MNKEQELFIGQLLNNEEFRLKYFHLLNENFIYCLDLKIICKFLQQPTFSFTFLVSNHKVLALAMDLANKAAQHDIQTNEDNHSRQSNP